MRRYGYQVGPATARLGGGPLALFAGFANAYGFLRCEQQHCGGLDESQRAIPNRFVSKGIGHFDSNERIKDSCLCTNLRAKTNFH